MRERHHRLFGLAICLLWAGAARGGDESSGDSSATGIPGEAGSNGSTAWEVACESETAGARVNRMAAVLLQSGLVDQTVAYPNAAEVKICWRDPAIVEFLALPPPLDEPVPARDGESDDPQISAETARMLMDSFWVVIEGGGIMAFGETYRMFVIDPGMTRSTRALLRRLEERGLEESGSRSGTAFEHSPKLWQDVLAARGLLD